MFASNQIIVDEVERVERNKMYAILTKVFHLVYADLCGEPVFKESKEHCNGCVTNHPSQDQHDCLMLEEEERWNLFYERAKHQVDLNRIWQTTNEVCSSLNFSLHSSWKTYLTELYKQPWTSVYLWSLQLEQSFYDSDTAKKVSSYLSSERLDNNITTIACPTEFFRKDEEPMELDGFERIQM